MNDPVIVKNYLHVFASPDGIIVSDDGRHLFVAASANMTVFRLTRGTADPEVASAKVAGIPDNLRWSADGKPILVGVHTEDPMQFGLRSSTSIHEQSFIVGLRMNAAAF